MSRHEPFDYEKPKEFCSSCRNNGTAVCCSCSNYMGVPDLWEKKPETRFELIRTLDTDELAAYLELELGDSVPSDWLAWLTERVEMHEPL